MQEKKKTKLFVILRIKDCHRLFFWYIRRNRDEFED